MCCSRQLKELGGLQCTVAEAARGLLVSKSALVRFMAKYPEAVEAFEGGTFMGRASQRHIAVYPSSALHQPRARRASGGSAGGVSAGA